jgi:putative heme-binding domain-containing protein
MDTLLPHLGQTDGVWRTNRPGGWICRLDPEGRQWELVAVGLRNPYDFAFNADGEMFTFDADMEWDLGTPWYRPTRVNHVTRGAEFGWRTGSSKWPDYYADSLPAIYDVGESSPTGLAFGYGARFPAQYQRALFMGDWSYGKIFALHLEPAGSTYKATLEQFLAGSPLPITDLVIRPQDGALYFLTGGRGTPSLLYRVRYTGAEPTQPVTYADPRNQKDRKLRQHLEALFGSNHPEPLSQALNHLAHPDRATRYAARLALEHQPLATRADRALQLEPARARLQALLALTRCGEPLFRPRVLASLAELKWETLPHESRLDLVRVASLTCIRWGTPSGTERQSLISQFNPRFPTDQYDLNRELSQLLVYLEAPGVVDRALQAMETAPSQEEQLHYALCLRTLDPNLWQPSQRERFFGWITRATSAGGGVTYSEYLRSIRSEAIEKLTPAVHESLKPILAQKPPPDPYAELKQRTLVQEWTVDALLPEVARGPTGRDAQRGRAVYTAAMCIKCHRFSRQGGLTGPDLTGVAHRFDDRTLLESILEPSKVVSDQYATVEILTKDGESHTGRIGDQNDQEVLLKADLLNPANIRRIRWDQIDSVQPSPLSLMPTNLLDYFTRDEILDLIALLKSAPQP